MYKTFSEAIVINLERDKARWLSMQKQLKRLQIQPIRLNAVDGRLLDNKEIHKRTSLFGEYFLSPSTIGSALSHQAAWSWIIENERSYALILEDDAIFDEKCDELFEKIRPSIPADWEILNFSDYGVSNANGQYSLTEKFFKTILKTLQKHPQPRRRINEHIFVPEFFCCIQGYAVSYRGAQKLLDMHKQIKYILDVQMSLQLPFFKFYCIAPNLIIQDFETSNLTGNTAPTASVTSAAAESKSSPSVPMEVLPTWVQKLLTSSAPRSSLRLLRGLGVGWKNIPLTYVMDIPIVSINRKVDVTLVRLVYLVIGLVIGTLPKEMQTSLEVFLPIVGIGIILLLAEHLLWQKDYVTNKKQWKHFAVDLLFFISGLTLGLIVHR